MSIPPSPEDRLVDFYSVGYDESARLARPKSRLEFRRVQELLRAHLPPPPARVLDVGGGKGAHAGWLAGDGYQVDLVDIVPEHVRAVGELADRSNGLVSASVGDARSLQAGDGSVDACLLLGPLYHLPEPPDRAKALAEAVRVTRSGGVVIAAALSRCAWPLYPLRDGDDLSPERIKAIEATLASGRGDPVGALPNAYSHLPSELANEFDHAGLADVDVLGIEGPGWTLFTPDLPEDQVDDLLDLSVQAARLCDSHPEMTAASAHLLAFGQRR